MKKMYTKNNTYTGCIFKEIEILAGLETYDLIMP